AVARGARVVEQAIVERARAAAAVAVDHDHAGEARGVAHRVLGGAALEARVAGAVDHALEPAVAALQREAGGEERLVVDAGLRVEQMRALQIALAASHGVEAGLAPHGDHACAKTAGAEAREDDVEPHAVAADDGEIDAARALSREREDGD